MTYSELMCFRKDREKLMYLLDKLESVELSAYPGGGSNDGMPGSGKISDKVACIAIEAADLKARVNYAYKCIKKQTDEFLRLVNSMERCDKKLFISYFYGCISLETSAALAGMSVEEAKKTIAKYIGGDDALSTKEDG